MAEKDCGEIGLAEKSKSTAGEKVKERQIRSCGGNGNEIEKSYAGGNRYRQIS